MVQRTLKRSFPEPTERDDVFQEVWLTIARKLPGFQWRQGMQGFQGWMAKLIRHKTVDMIRRRRRQPSRVGRGQANEDWEPVDAAGDPARLSLPRRQWEAMQAVLAHLRPRIPETNFHILRLHYWEGWTVREIAAQVGLTPEQVWSRLHRLLRKVRRGMPSDLGEDFGKNARQAQTSPSV
jgi:RNA polymerase sigma-70 factor (ECF subfamily)